MRAGLFRRAIAVAVLTGFLGAGHEFGFTSQASAETFKVGTYNIHIAGPLTFGGWGINDWITTRRFLVKDAILANNPDILGFQEAFARDGSVQQSTLGEVFGDTDYRFYSWAVDSDYATANDGNWNPIIVNTERFNHVAAGSRTVNFETHLGSDGQIGGGAWDWDDYHRLHEIFHDSDHDPNGPFSAHSLTPERYVNWVVSEDISTGKKVAFLTSHYETFIGNNEYDPLLVNAEYNMTYGDLFDVFSDIVNDSFGYASEQIDAQAEELRTLYGDLGVIIGGDFETGDPTLPAQTAFSTAGYEETYRYIHSGSMMPRPTQGIDVMWTKTSDFNIEDSDYDRTDYTNGDGSIQASDHDPLFAEVSFVPEPSSLIIALLSLMGMVFLGRRRRPSANGPII